MSILNVEETDHCAESRNAENCSRNWNSFVTQQPFAIITNVSVN